MNMRFYVIYALTAICALMGQHTIKAQGGRCRNPNNHNGQCLSIYNCPPLLSILKSNLNQSGRKFLQNSKCDNGFGRLPYVCCTEDTGYITTQKPIPDEPVRPTIAPAPGDGKGIELPSPPVCGKQSLGNKIYGGDKTALSEFQWTALLGYRSVGNGQTVFECGGSLINQRYVLTAAHCVTGRINTDVGLLTQVRLGEYNTDTLTDCDEDRDCTTNQHLDIPVELAIPHKGFNDSSVHRHNDIALIRLSRNVEYGDFVKPVCMPWVVNGGLRSAPTGTNLTVAGWGRTLLSRKSNIKQKLDLPLNDQTNCAEKFAARKVNIVSSQLCAGGLYAQDSCDGDSGGPLMRKVNNYWTLQGIVSFGNRCGLDDWPGIYTRVSEFESWIKQNLRA